MSAAALESEITTLEWFLDVEHGKKYTEEFFDL